VRDIIESGWIDQKTRLVVIDMIAYSPQTDLFADITISFEYLPGGLLHSSRSVQTMLLDRLPPSHIHFWPTRDEKNKKPSKS
jgi:hypothetical protein